MVDDGPGIAAEARRDLCSAGRRAQAGQKLGQGAGLGLAIVARYAQLLGARIGLHEALGGGLQVEIEFPGVG